MAPKLASTLLSQLQKEYKEIAKFALNELGSSESEVNFDEPLNCGTLLEFATALTQRVMREDGDLSYATRSALENFVRGHSIPAHPSDAAWKRYEALQAAEAATADKRAFLRHARNLVVEALEAAQQGGGTAGGSKGGKGGGAGAGKGAVSLPAIKTLVQEEWEAQGGSGFDAAKVTAAVKALVLKGVVVQVGGRYHLAKGKDKPKPKQPAAAVAAAAAAMPSASPAAKKTAAAATGRKPAAQPSPKAPKAAKTTRAPAVARKNPLPPGPSSPAKRSGGAAAATVAAKPVVSKSPAYKAAGAAAGTATHAAAPRGKTAAKAAKAKPRQARAGAAGATAASAKDRAGARAAAATGVKKTPTKKTPTKKAAKPRASKAAALTKAAAAADAGGEAAEPPEVVDGKPMWKIEKFVSLRKGRGRGKRMLRVRWQGWSADDDSWLAEKQLVEDLGAQGFAELLQELEAAGGVRGSKAKALKGGREAKATAVKGGVAKGGGARKRAGAAPKRAVSAAGGRGKK